MKKEDATLTLWLGDAPGEPTREPVLDALDALLGKAPSAERTRAAQARLRQALADERARGVWYDSITAPRLGQVFFAATTIGLVSIAFDRGERAFRDHLREAFGIEPARAEGRLRRVGQQLREYLSGRRTRFDLPLDLRALTDFQRRVLLAALNVPRGQTSTYAEIARRIGHPRAARAVGQVLRRNPVPIVIPCHRVVASDGSLRGYLGSAGVKTKAWLLALEGAQTWHS
jgi:methylated-DNA-[protein]-cysteine S-methyltransferase